MDFHLHQMLAFTNVIIDWTNELGGLDPPFVKRLLHRMVKYEDAAIILYREDKQTSDNITIYPSM